MSSTVALSWGADVGNTDMMATSPDGPKRGGDTAATPGVDASASCKPGSAAFAAGVGTSIATSRGPL